MVGATMKIIRYRLDFKWQRQALSMRDYDLIAEPLGSSFVCAADDKRNGNPQSLKEWCSETPDTSRV